MFNRTMVSPDARLPQPLRAGDGFIANVAVTENPAEADLVVTTAALGGGFITQTTVLTSDVNFTIPIGTLIDAEFPTMDVGDSFLFNVTSAQSGAFDVVVVVGAGVTLKGLGTVAPQSSRMFALVKTGVALYDLF